MVDKIAKKVIISERNKKKTPTKSEGVF